MVSLSLAGRSLDGVTPTSLGVLASLLEGLSGALPLFVERVLVLLLLISTVILTVGVIDLSQMETEVHERW